MIRKKKEAMGSVGYMFLFMIVMIMVIVSMYLLQVAKLITHQHDVDDALADSVLASLIMDEEYFFETDEFTGEAVVRIKDKDECYAIYKECMNAAIEGKEDFYYNFVFDTFIFYEVSENTVTISKYGATGNVSTSDGTLGIVKTPDGKIVEETSAYALVKFDIKSILDGSYINKSRSIYCTIKKN